MDIVRELADVPDARTCNKVLAERLDKMVHSKNNATLEWMTIRDMQSNRSFRFPREMQGDFFKLYCEALHTFGSMDSLGDSNFHWCVIPQRGDYDVFQFRVLADLKDNVSDDTRDAIYRLLIAASARAISNKLEPTSSRKNTRTCLVSEASDGGVGCMSAKITFPYCRMRHEDLIREVYPEVERFLAECPIRLQDIFLDPTWENHLIFEDPSVGVCFGSSFDVHEPPVDFLQGWFVESVPETHEQLVTEEHIFKVPEEEMSEFAEIQKHYMFLTHPAPRNTPEEVEYYRPLLTTEGLAHDTLCRLPRGSNAPVQHSASASSSSSSSSSGTAAPTTAVGRRRESPFMQSQRARLEERERARQTEDGVREDLITLVFEMRHEDDPLKYINETPSRKSLVCKGFSMFLKYSTQMHSLLGYVAKQEEWFNITEKNNGDKEPWIMFSAGGPYLRLDALSMIMEQLSKDRCVHTSVLSDIACALHTLCNPRDQERKDDLRKTFIDFVQNKNPNQYRIRGGETGLNKLFDTQNERSLKRRITFWSLLSFLEEDDPVYYHFWMQHLRDYYMLRATLADMGSYSVAKAISMYLYGTYLRGKNNVWYKYNGAHFEDNDGSEVQKFIASMFPIHNSNMADRYGTTVVGGFENEKKATHSILRSKIDDRPFRMKILEDVGLLLMDKRIDDMARGDDSEMADITATMNCVLEFSDGTMIPRKGRWEDFQTKAMDTIYENIPPSDPRCKFLMKWVHQMLRDPAKEREFWKRLASCLRGYNRDKTLDILYGSGNNGKSLFFDLFVQTFGVGKKAVKMPLETLLEGAMRNGSSASPEIDQARGALVAVLDEPKKGQRFDASRIKSMTGNDNMYSRTLHDKGSAFRPFFKTFLIGNTVPRATYDYALKIRFWIWKFIGRFEDNAPKDEEEQERLGIYPKDKELQSNLGQYKAPLLSLLLHYFKIYYKEGVSRAPVEKDIRDYWASTNEVVRYIEHYIREKEGNTIPIDMMFSSFRTWVRAQNDKDRPLTRHEFEEEIQSIFIEQDIAANGGLLGFELIQKRGGIPSIGNSS